MQHAHVVCEFLYSAVMKLISEVPVGPDKEIEWAKALSEARSALLDNCTRGVPAQAAARGCKVWTIPALYARREPFLLRRIATSLPGNVGMSPAKKKLIDYLQVLQQQRTKAAEDYKDLPAVALNAILKDFDDQIAAKTIELSQL